MYFNDKANIYRNQHDGDILIASAQAASEIIMRGEKVGIAIPEQQHFEMKLIGEHNQVAAGLAYDVASQCGLDDESIRASIASFAAVHGRLEDLGLFQNNVRVFNDNNATTCDAAMRAIESINQTYNKKPIVITGGADKGLPIDEYEKMLSEQTKAVVYLSGTGTDRISLSKDNQFEKLEDCIARAFELAEDGDIILFSPAFASFSKYFNNEYERNDLFVKEIQKYA